MINEIFDNHIITYSLAGYWDRADITVIEVWPRRGNKCDIDIVRKFKEYITND